MDKEQIEKAEEIIETFLFSGTRNTDYELKKLQVMTIYLIYQQLKEVNNNLKEIRDSLSLIDEALSG